MNSKQLLYTIDEGTAAFSSVKSTHLCCTVMQNSIHQPRSVRPWSPLNQPCMKRIGLFLLLLFCSAVLSAQTTTYVGTLTVDGYTRHNVTAKVSVNNNSATMVLYDVKFARMMPVKVDATIPKLHASTTNGTTTLSGTNIVPTVGSKSHTKHIVKNLRGTCTASQLSTTMMLGDKKTSFSGKAKR